MRHPISAHNRHRVIAGQYRHMRGWRRGHFDPKMALLPSHRLAPLPSSVDLRVSSAQWMPNVRDQGSIGSCTAHAGVEMMGYVHRKLFGGPDPFFSALDLYAATRAYEGTPLSEDSGAMVADVLKVLHQDGVCVDTLWPYDVGKFSEQPPDDAVADAKHHLALSIFNCPTLDSIRASLADGIPVDFGFDCFESLESDETSKTGQVSYPTPDDKSIGGHSVLAVGYTPSVLIFQNSWGTSWGDGGFGYLPVEYVEHRLASDFHTVRTESQ